MRPRRGVGAGGVASPSRPCAPPSPSTAALLLLCTLLSFFAGRLTSPPPPPLPSNALPLPPPPPYHAALRPAATAAPAAPPLPLFSFSPSVRQLWINIGSHKDPPLPPDLASTAVLAVEPIMQTAMRINRTHANIFVLCAAVSDAVGFSSMQTFNSGASSSLSKPAEGRWWAAPGFEHRTHGMPPVAFVPVLTLRHLIDAVPAAIEIAFLKTDMQGSDLRAVASAGRNALRRVARLMTEVYCGAFSEYDGVNNSFAAWLPMMQSRGFELDPRLAPPCPPTKLGEADVHWQRVGAAV